MKYFRVLSFSFILFLVGSPVFVLAQDTAVDEDTRQGVYGAVINATVLEYTVEKGRTISDSFELRHDYPEADLVVTLFPVTSDFTADGKSGTPVFLEKGRNKPKTSLEDWIKPLDKSYTVTELGDTAEVRFEISVPADAEPGSYTAALLLSDSEYNPSAGPNQVALASRLGPLIFVTVPGDIKSNLEVSSFDVKDAWGNGPFLGMFEWHPLNFVLTLRNTGNVYLTPGGSITVHQGDLAKPTYLIQNINEGKGSVLSGTTREFVNTWSDGAFRFDGTYNEQTKTTDYSFAVHPEDLNKIRFGRYNATLQLFYKDKATGENARVDYAVSFWLLPWKVILITAVIIVGYYYFKNRMVNKKQGKKKSLMSN